MTADLYQQAQVIDRKAALTWARTARATLNDLPEPDRAAPDTILARSAGDELADAVSAGARGVTIWLHPDSDVAAIGSGRIAALARRVAIHGVAVNLIVAPGWLETLDTAQRLGLRDAAFALGRSLRRGTALAFPNGAIAIAATDRWLWASRDARAARAGPD